MISAILAITALSAGCERPTNTPENSRKTANNALKVVTSTTMLADLVRQIGGDSVTADSIVSTGADPHLYRPTPNDARSIAQSDLVIRNGLSLEGWMNSVIKHAGGQRPVITASKGIEPLNDPTEPAALDPHFWFDPQRWASAIVNVSQALQKLLPKEEAQRVAQRTKTYIREVQQLDSWIEENLATIPEKHRVLVTSHDAFNYFGDRYDIRVVAIQGLSTEEEASQRDLANVISTVQQYNVPAVFVESSVNPRMIEQVARETGATKSGPLYSDSTGPIGSGAETYIGMVEANIKMIVEALGGRYTPRT